MRYESVLQGSDHPSVTHKTPCRRCTQLLDELLLLLLLLLTFFATSTPTATPTMMRMMRVRKKHIQRFLRYPLALTLAASRLTRLKYPVSFCLVIHLKGEAHPSVTYLLVFTVFSWMILTVSSCWSTRILIYRSRDQ